MSQSTEALRAAALIVIDVQQGLDEPVWGTRNNPDAEANIARLLAAWRSAGAPIYHVHHNSVRPTSPLRPGQPGNAFKPEALPLAGEPVFEKTVNSAFIGTGLEQRLRDDGIERVVIAGLTTNHCVESSARMAANLGFDTWVVSDATATHDRTGPDGVHYSAETIHGVSLASLHGEFATVVDTAAVVGQIAVGG
jgi:nicotinamidase-related amidase